MSKPLTDTELLAVFYSIDQPHMLKLQRGLKAALRRARRKLQNEVMARRQSAIFKAGQKAARCGSTAPIFEGRKDGDEDVLRWRRERL